MNVILPGPDNRDSGRNSTSRSEETASVVFTLAVIGFVVCGLIFGFDTTAQQIAAVLMWAVRFVAPAIAFGADLLISAPAATSVVAELFSTGTIWPRNAPALIYPDLWATGLWVGGAIGIFQFILHMRRAGRRRWRGFDDEDTVLSQLVFGVSAFLYSSVLGLIIQAWLTSIGIDLPAGILDASEMLLEIGGSVELAILNLPYGDILAGGAGSGGEGSPSLFPLLALIVLMLSFVIGLMIGTSVWTAGWLVTNIGNLAWDMINPDNFRWVPTRPAFSFHMWWVLSSSGTLVGLGLLAWIAAT